MRPLASLVTVVLSLGSVGIMLPSAASAVTQPARTCTWTNQSRLVSDGSTPVGEWDRFVNNICEVSYRAHVRCNLIGQITYRNGPAEINGVWSKVKCDPAFLTRQGYQYYWTDAKWHTVWLPS